MALAAIAMVGPISDQSGLVGLCIALRYLTLMASIPKEDMDWALAEAEPIAAALIKLGTPWDEVQ